MCPPRLPFPLKIKKWHIAYFCPSILLSNYTKFPLDGCTWNFILFPSSLPHVTRFLTPLPTLITPSSHQYPLTHPHAHARKHALPPAWTHTHTHFLYLSIGRTGHCPCNFIPFLFPHFISSSLLLLPPLFLPLSLLFPLSLSPTFSLRFAHTSRNTWTHLFYTFLTLSPLI